MPELAPAPAAGIRYRAAVVGSPIVHSRSPELHRAGYRRLGLTGWQYDAIEMTGQQLVGWLEQLADAPAADGALWRGLSVTMPCKSVALEAAARSGGQVSEVAALTAAANTLRPVKGATGYRWDADNTDVEGIQQALRSAQAPLPAGLNRGVILGAGATARSAAVALVGLGVRELVVAARRPEPAAQVAQVAVRAASGSTGALAVNTVGLAQWTSHISADTLLVSALALPGNRAAAAAEPPKRPPALALDALYANWPTPLAAALQEIGGQVVSGMEMLIAQAAAQFVQFTACDPDARTAVAAAMRSAVMGN